MMLVLYEGEWCIGQRISESKSSFSLCVRPTAGVWARTHRFIAPPHEITLWRHFPDGNPSVRFFPTIKYRGVKVEPFLPPWHKTANEPILTVMNQWGSNDDVATYFGHRVSEDRRDAALRADGWEGDRHSLWTKYVHVDELEKIEGPVPDGPF